MNPLAEISERPRPTKYQIVPSVNVESAAYPLGICAETAALSAAATAGVRPGEIAAIGITASPCGGCRQWLYEWKIAEVSYRRADGSIGTGSAADLLPDSWDLPE